MSAILNPGNVKAVVEADAVDPLAEAAKIPAGTPVLLTCSDSDVQAGCDAVKPLADGAGAHRADPGRTQGRQPRAARRPDRQRRQLRQEGPAVAAADDGARPVRRRSNPRIDGMTKTVVAERLRRPGSARGTRRRAATAGRRAGAHRRCAPRAPIRSTTSSTAAQMGDDPAALPMPVGMEASGVVIEAPARARRLHRSAAGRRRGDRHQHQQRLLRPA